MARFPNGPDYSRAALAAAQSAMPSQWLPQRTAAYSPSIQFDQLAKTRHRMREHGRTINYFVPEDSANAPPQLHMVEFVAKIIAPNVPQLFMPGNPNRQYYSITNNTGAVINIQFGRSVGPGIALNVNSNFQQMGVTTTVDDIWIKGTVAGAVVSGYQGILSAGYTPQKKRRRKK